MRVDGVLSALVSLAAIVGSTVGSEADNAIPPRQACRPPLGNQTIFDFSIRNVYDNATINMSQFRGKLTLVVNVATY
ncbi:hypothetical protein DPMN_074898 [Dreissena polymorpha]|uniref:Glutathione peroxidase n=1 Tax=Dreissena polymorpha TaxID=45954 RepID=A0A9D3YFU6_DREPO|nr:hypothetical protein DPMN_074898 [Dreissena polymorpha]